MAACLARVPRFIIALAGMGAAASAQPAAQAPAFEVASVKIHDRSASHVQRAPKLEHGRFTAQNVPLSRLLSEAYGVVTSQIRGPEWIDSETYDLEAKVAEGYVPDKDSLQPLLQALLRERFQLTVHRETKEMSAYDLIPAKGGAKLSPYDPEVGPVSHSVRGGAGMGGRGVPMPELANSLARSTGTPVVDRTGIEGRFNYFLNYAVLRSDEDLGVPDLFAALEEQLGLKLVSRKQPIEILIVDHAERVPTEN